MESLSRRFEGEPCKKVQYVHRSVGWCTAGWEAGLGEARAGSGEAKSGSHHVGGRIHAVSPCLE